MPEVKTGKPLSYHFDAPAGIWEASFPLGNGRLGLMPDGGVDTENIVRLQRRRERTGARSKCPVWQLPTAR